MPGSLPETMPEPAGPDRGAALGARSHAHDDRLDASAHAHLLEEPLSPDAATETAVIYNVTLASPHADAADDTPAVAAGPEGADPPVVRRTSARGAPALPAGGNAPSDVAAPGPAEQPPEAGLPAAGAGAPARAAASAPRIPTARKAGAAAAVLLVFALTTLAGYLWVSATEWRERAGSYEHTALGLGEELSTVRNQLAGSQAELEAVRAQLATTHERIVELADEKNQALDDWELTQQLVDYQQRISEAAASVALALDQCVQGQQELIGVLQRQIDPGPGPTPTSTPTPYDPALVAEFQTQVEALCQEASEANIALQLELAR